MSTSNQDKHHGSAEAGGEVRERTEEQMWIGKTHSIRIEGYGMCTAKYIDGKKTS